MATSANVDVAERMLVITRAGQELRRMPFVGSGQGACTFAQFVEQLHSEARTGRRGVVPSLRQLILML